MKDRKNTGNGILTQYNKKYDKEKCANEMQKVVKQRHCRTHSQTHTHAHRQAYTYTPMGTHTRPHYAQHV